MPDTCLRKWKTLSKKTVLQYNKFLTVEEHAVELPDGRLIPNWSWIIIPDAAIVTAVTREGKFLSFRQTKYAIEGITLAPVAGMLDSGEAPLAAAKRELLEETGYEADVWTHLGSFCLDPNRGVNTIHLFLAQEAHPVAMMKADDLEDQQLVLLDRNEVEKALLLGEYKAIMWTTAISMALLYLQRSVP